MHKHIQTGALIWSTNKDSIGVIYTDKGPRLPFYKTHTKENIEKKLKDELLLEFESIQIISLSSIIHKNEIHSDSLPQLLYIYEVEVKNKKEDSVIKWLNISHLPSSFFPLEALELTQKNNADTQTIFSNEVNFDYAIKNQTK
ncbi:MAG: hypothetical protein CL678_12040 [Bdellovibrionaceae bacterium]|nr:hypothetical protein [Pseudobdellovibrionaceae bacterium]|tara:strand:- start:6028 stop:6456 length:429 start_codon:yes stop_codon:yes gene_type:complete